MAGRRALIKKHAVMLRLNDQDAADLKRAAALESTRRGEIVPESVLLRDLAMPKVRELLAAEAA
jgi:hypothetical protein